MPKLVNIGRRLRDERLKMGLKQSEFAALGGASLNSQTRYETGAFPPKIEYLLKLEDGGVDIGYVITGRRSDGSLDITQRWLVDLFEDLDDIKREALMRFVMAFAGEPLEMDKVLKQGRAEQPLLNDQKADFRGENEQ